LLCKTVRVDNNKTNSHIYIHFYLNIISKTRLIKLHTTHLYHLLKIYAHNTTLITILFTTTKLSLLKLWFRLHFSTTNLKSFVRITDNVTHTLLYLIRYETSILTQRGVVLSIWEPI